MQALRGSGSVVLLTLNLDDRWQWDQGHNRGTIPPGKSSVSVAQKTGSAAGLSLDGGEV